MIKIGVTGLIASGKSAVSRLLSEHLGYPIIDADELSREVSGKNSKVVQEVELAFGSEYVIDGEMDRDKVAEKVFKDKEALARLNAIIHHRVGERYFELLGRYEQLGIEGVLFDCPLLIESNIMDTVDVVVLVYTEYTEQIRRLVELRNYTEEHAHDRIRNQMPFEEKRPYADVIVKNSQSLAELERRIPQIAEDIKRVYYEKKLLHNE
jgi:dephospho-CoA kinase